MPQAHLRRDVITIRLRAHDDVRIRRVIPNGGIGFPFEESSVLVRAPILVTLQQSVVPFSFDPGLDAGVCRRRNPVRRRPRAFRGLSIFALAAVLALGGAACGGSSSDDLDAPATSVTTTPSTTVGRVPDACDEVTGLFPVAAVLDASGSPCGRWVDRSIGRAVRGSTGSASVWSRRTEHGTVLIVGAVHTLGQGWFGPADTAVADSKTPCVSPAQPGSRVRSTADGPSTGPPTLIFGVESRRVRSRDLPYLPRKDGPAGAIKVGETGYPTFPYFHRSYSGSRRS